MSLNAKEVGEILKALESSSFDSLDLEIGAVKLSLRRSGAGQAARRDATGAAGQAGTGTPSPATPAHATPAHATAVQDRPPHDPRAAPADAVPAPPGAIPVPAPLLGVFYRAPKPGEEPYVQVGDRVEPDTLIGIIEVMKLMNTVRAGISGRIVAIPARNGELIEFGEAILFVHPD